MGYFDAIVAAGRAVAGQASGFDALQKVAEVAVRLFDLVPALLEEARSGREDLQWAWLGLEFVFMERRYTVL